MFEFIALNAINKKIKFGQPLSKGGSKTRRKSLAKFLAPEYEPSFLIVAGKPIGVSWSRIRFETCIYHERRINIHRLIAYQMPDCYQVSLKDALADSICFFTEALLGDTIETDDLWGCPSNLLCQGTPLAKLSSISETWWTRSFSPACVGQTSLKRLVWWWSWWSC